jgi:hypothetical protein
MRQSVIRLSTTSIAGSAPPIAASARVVVTPGPATSLAITKAISASTRGATSASRPTSSVSSTNMSSSRAPKFGSRTPSSSCDTREVSPTLRPHSTAPAATRRSTLRLCAA